VNTAETETFLLGRRLGYFGIGQPSVRTTLLRHGTMADKES